MQPFSIHYKRYIPIINLNERKRRNKNLNKNKRFIKTRFLTLLILYRKPELLKDRRKTSEIKKRF